MLVIFQHCCSCQQPDSIFFSICLICFETFQTNRFVIPVNDFLPSGNVYRYVYNFFVLEKFHDPSPFALTHTSPVPLAYILDLVDQNGIPTGMPTLINPNKRCHVITVVVTTLQMLSPTICLVKRIAKKASKIKA